MDRRSYFLLVLFLGALILCFSDSKELFRELTCYHDSLNIDCGDQSIIAIHQAYFTSQRQENHTCNLIEDDYIEDEDQEEATNHSYCFEDVRLIINKRCSGLNNCSFVYSKAPKLCSNPEGVLIVQFDCVREPKINKYCNAKVTANEGYIMQPGYPKFYPKLTECSWSLSASEGQTIVVKILHLHLSPATEVVPTVADHDDRYVMGIGQLTEPVTHCDKDSLSVLEGNMKRFSMCGEDLKNLKTFEADASNDLVLKFKSSAFLPASGFLAYYKIQGCPDMPAGEDSYLVERNGTAAIYACRNDLVFNDTLENTRFVHCIRDHHWSNTLSPCIQNLEETSTVISVSYVTAMEQFENATVLMQNSEVTVPTNPRFTEDILIPCVIIAILIVGNIAIVFVIFLIRRRQKNSDEFEEEQKNLEQAEEANTSP